MKKIIVAMPTGFFSLLATLFLVYLSLAANPLDVQSVTALSFKIKVEK